MGELMKVFSYIIVLVAVLFLSINSWAYAEDAQTQPSVVYVSVTGNDNNNGLSLNTSKASIKNAIKTVVNGGTIIVKPGKYRQPLYIRKNVTIIGENEDNTIIEGMKGYVCITIAYGTKILIKGFTIQNGMIGIESNSNELIVRNTKIQNNVCSGISNGGVLSLFSSTIQNNKYGIKNYGSLSIYRSTIQNNNLDKKEDGGSIFNGEKMVVKNCLITHNYGYTGGGIYSIGHVDLINSVVIDNNAFCGGGIYISLGDLNVKNSVIKNNFAWQGGGIYNNARVLLDKDTVISGNWMSNTHGI
jgi:hypothetical protein